MISQNRQVEIQQLIESSPDIRSLYRSFLNSTVQLAKADLGIAWECSDELSPLCQTHRKGSAPMKLAISESYHTQLIQEAAGNESTFAIRPRTDGNSRTAEEQPILMFGPVRGRSGTQVIELVLPGTSSQELLYQLQEDIDYFRALMANLDVDMQSDAPSASKDQSRPAVSQINRESLDQFSRQIHATIDLDDTVRAVANEARRVLECDRVSVAVKKAGRFRIASISGQPSVNRRSNTTQLLRTLCSRTLVTGQSFWYPNDVEVTPPQIQGPLNEYLDVAATRTMAILPIYDKSNINEGDQDGVGQVVAGLIVEHCNELWAQEEIAPDVELIQQHASDAIRNALEHRSLFGYPIWKLLGQSKVIAATRNLPKSIAVSVLLLVVGLVLTFLPAPFTLHGEGTLQPQIRQKVFATVEGEVATIKVSHRSRVNKSDELLTLRNESLDLQIEQVRGEIQALETRLNHEYLMHGHLESREEIGEQMMQSNSAAMEKQKESLQKQLALLEEKVDKLSVQSPIRGEVVTWDVQNRLNARPVRPGELLMEVADVDGQWEIEMDLPERRAGHLLREMELREKNENDEPIVVTYQPAADPGVSLEGRIVEVSRAMRLNSDQTQSIRVRVAISTEDIEQIRQAGSSVAARIHCGKRSLGYVWLHELLEVVQSKVLFRIW